MVTVQCFGVFGFVFNVVLICFLGVWKFVVILGFYLFFKKELKARQGKNMIKIFLNLKVVLDN